VVAQKSKTKASTKADVAGHKVAISYSRVSTGKQSAEDRSGQERQQRAIESWLAEHPDYSLDREIRVTVSGAKAGRFEWFISELEKGVLPRGTCLVVEKVSRFSREPIEDVLKTLLRLWDAGGAIAFCELGGKVLSGFAQDSGDVYVVVGAIQRARGEWLERQDRSLAARRKERDLHKQGTHKPKPRGKRGRADYPFWLDVKDGKYVPNDWAAHIKTIFNLAQTLGVTRIANHLDSQGIKAVSDGRRRWTSNSVTGVLRNEAALGFKVFWKDNKPSDEKVLCYPPVVTQEEWDAAQTALLSRSQSRPSNNSPTQQNLFAGSIYCRHCGSPMVVKNAGNGQRFLRCRNDFSICTQRGHKYLEAFLLNHLAQYRWEEFFNAGVQEAALTSARSSLLEAEKVLRSIQEDVAKVNSNITKLTTSDSPELLRVLPQFSRQLDKLLADQNVAQVAVDEVRAEVNKLTHQQTGREAERALKRQINGFISGKDNSLEQRVSFNTWLREQKLVLCLEDGHAVAETDDQEWPADEMKAFVYLGEPVFDQGRLVMVNCLLETMKNHPAFNTLPDGLMEKVHSRYRFEDNTIDPERFQKGWEEKIEMGWPIVDLIGVRTPEEHDYWQKVVAAGGKDTGSTLEGNIGFINHPETYDSELVGPWTSREQRKRGRPAKRKRSG
jgi:DNA invertase Pin-like site-specific DNA recombinase